MSKPYCVTWEWGDWATFATFEEALAFRNAEHPDGKITNQDNVDVIDDWDDDGRQRMFDGLTEEEKEAAL